jgi:Domain of unknown function (DUF4124)
MIFQYQRALAVAGFCLAFMCNAQAQGKLYKHVDANGLVTYTDQPGKPEEKPMDIANTARNGNNPARAKQAANNKDAGKKGAARNAAAGKGVANHKRGARGGADPQPKTD